MQVSVYNRCVVNDDGSTPHEAMHGQRFKGKLAESAEHVFYVCPHTLRSNVDRRWGIGACLGNSQSSNEAFVASSGSQLRIA